MLKYIKERPLEREMPAQEASTYLIQNLRRVCTGELPPKKEIKFPPMSRGKELQVSHSIK